MRPPFTRSLCAQLSLLRLPAPSQVLQDIAEDFVENVAAFACELVKHRAGETLEVKDLQLAIGELAHILGALATAPEARPSHPELAHLLRQRKIGTCGCLASATTSSG